MWFLSDEWKQQARGGKVLLLKLQPQQSITWRTWWNSGLGNFTFLKALCNNYPPALARCVLQKKSLEERSMLIEMSNEPFKSARIASLYPQQLLLKPEHGIVNLLIRMFHARWDEAVNKAQTPGPKVEHHCATQKCQLGNDLSQLWRIHKEKA